MKRTTRIAIALSIALSAAFAATAIQAHPYGNGPGWGMGGGQGWGPGHMMGHRFGFGTGFGRQTAGDPRAFVEGRLTALKSELKITPAQEVAWNAYADQAKQQAGAMQKWRETMHSGAPAKLPERLELRDQLHQQRQAQVETMTQKIKDLYAALTPEQQVIADQRLGGFGLAMHGGPGYRNR